MEYSIGTDVKEVPRFAQAVQSEELTDARISLSYIEAEYRGKSAGAWLLGITPFTNRSVLRRLRLNLLRLHAEIESIREVFRLIATSKIAIDRGTSASDNLQKYLHSSVSLLSRETRDGIPQSKIMDIAYSAPMIEDGERKSLLEQLRGIRRNYFYSIEKFTQTKDLHPHQPVYNITGEHASVTFAERSISVARQTQNIFGNVTGNVNQVAAETKRVVLI